MRVVLQPKVALVHDDLVQWGGAERILSGICEIFPQAPIYTSVFDRTNTLLNNAFGSKKVVTSFLQKIPWWKNIYKVLLPFYPFAFEQFSFDSYDLVISNTTRFAKAIITKPDTFHVCYCHTPPRFLWHLSGEKNYGLGELLMTKLRIYDQISSRRVDYFLAGSENAKKRIKKVYKRDAKVIYPFVDLDRFKQVDTFDGGYFLCLGRPNKYKRMDLALQACQSLGIELKIISGNLDDDTVVKIIAGCKALIIPGEEDFGLVSLEAAALGKPVVAFAKGGNLETVIDETSGIFFKKQTVESLTEALVTINKIKFNPTKCRINAERFSKEAFIKRFSQILAELGYTI